MSEITEWADLTDNNMAFETLPSRLGPIEQFHPMPVAPPPIYDTSQTIHQLQALAEYFSPDARAKRQAAVAKARWEYQMYAGGGMSATWKYQADKRRADMAKTEAQTEWYKRRTQGTGSDPDVTRAMKSRGQRPISNTALNMHSDSMPPEVVEDESDSSNSNDTGDLDAGAPN